LGSSLCPPHMVTPQEFFSTAHVFVYQFSTFLLLGEAMIKLA
jgi:hypothetical protein